MLIMFGCTSCTANNPIVYTTNLDITITDINYSPYTWTVPAGEEIRLNLHNKGSIEHNWSLIGWPVSIPYNKSDLEKIFFQVSINAGESKVVTFKAPLGPGEYEVVSIMNDHYEEGLIGKLIVIHASEIPSQPSEQSE